LFVIYFLAGPDRFPDLQFKLVPLKVECLPLPILFARGESKRITSRLLCKRVLASPNDGKRLRILG
jgi:hypothetical protein